MSRASVCQFGYRKVMGKALGLVLGVALGTALSACSDKSGQEATPMPPDGLPLSGGGNGGGGSGTGGAGGGADDLPALQCATCSKKLPCGEGFTCVTSPDGHAFCATNCTGGCSDDEYECVSLSEYDSTVAKGKGCVPTSGQSCRCTAALQGQQRVCSAKIEGLTCSGFETCKSGKWGACDARAKEPEICDGRDNDCNGFVDEDEPDMTGNDLCGGSGLPHSEYVCRLGKCEVGECDQGWARFPETLPVKAGCACKIDDDDIDLGEDPDEPEYKTDKNNTCKTATDKGEMKDSPASEIIIEGTLHSDADEDWYGIDAIDVTEIGLNSFSFKIKFAENGNQGDEYQLDVIASKSENKCGTSGKKTGVTSYDSCAVANADTDKTSHYSIRVYRKAGASKTCIPYKLNISNGNGCNSTPDAGVDGGM